MHKLIIVAMAAASLLTGVGVANANVDVTSTETINGKKRYTCNSCGEEMPQLRVYRRPTRPVVFVGRRGR
jgi:hypothetical protein